MKLSRIPLIVSTAVLVASHWGAGSAAAVTVFVNAGLGLPALVDAAGTPVPDGNEVQIGYFDLGFDVAANAADLAALRSAWNAFGVTEVATILGEPGRLGGSVSKIDPSFDNLNIFWFAFNTANDLPPLPDSSNVDEYGVFSSTQPDWRFPVEGAAMTSTLTSSNEVDLLLFGGLDPSGNLQLQPVIPEPDAALLLLLSGATLIAGRHRRNQ